MNVSKAVISTLQQLDEQLFQTLEEYLTSLELKRSEWMASIHKDLNEYEKTGILRKNEPDASKFSTNSALSSNQVRIATQMKKSNEVVKPNAVKTLKHVEVKEEVPHYSTTNVRSILKKKPTEASITIQSDGVDEHLKNQEDNRDSDVQIQKETVETIVLEDSALVPKLEQIRTTRARTKRLRKDNKSESTESESNTTTRITQIKKKSTKLEENDKNNYNNSVEQPVPKGETSKRKAEDFNDLDVEDTSSSIGTNESNNSLNETQIVNKPTLINTIVVTNPAQPTIRSTRRKRNKKKRSENGLQNDKDSDDSPHKQSLTTKSATIDLKETTTIKVGEFNDLNTENTSTPIVTNESSTNVNETQIINKPTVMNATMVVIKPTQPAFKLITSDDEDVVSDSPPQPKWQKITKAVFSPYDQSPVKKKIAGFEQLGSNSKLPVSTFKETSSDNDLRKNVFQIKTKEISKLFATPLRDTRLRHLQTSSTSKLHSNTPTSSLTSVTSNKAVTGLKTSASKTEFRERELRRKQKESDALHKKEALIFAQIEEKRKKREEREMKVQQVKIAMEKDKQKQLEMAEKAKHEKLKQVEAEKEAKYMKQKEEMAKKRAAASKKVQEAKQKEEINNKHIPPYLQYETPLLPTPDCYDSDDPTRKQKINFPLWQMKPQITQAQYCMRNLELLKKTFFLSGPRTPDLLEIFPSIQPSKLKRTSSAIWNKTEMSRFENFSEDE